MRFSRFVFPSLSYFGKVGTDGAQFNFYDHSKLILSSHGLLVTHIDKHYKMTRWTLSDIMAQSLSPPANQDSEQAKFVQRLVDKLKYCKEVLISIRTASASGGVVEESEAMGEALVGGNNGDVEMGTKSSKVSLR